MYDIAIGVVACLNADTRVDVAWAVETRGFGSRDHAEALMLTPGGGRVGSVMSGSLNDRLAELAGRDGRGRIVDLHVGEVDALVVGLSCGGDARCLLVPATELPAELWQRLVDRERVAEHQAEVRRGGGQLLQQGTEALVLLDGGDGRACLQQGAGEAAGPRPHFDDAVAGADVGKARDLAGDVEVQQEVLAERLPGGQAMGGEGFAERRQVFHV